MRIELLDVWEMRRKGKEERKRGGEGDQGKKKEGEGGKYSLSCLFNYHTMIVFSYK